MTETLQRDVNRLRAFARQTQRKLHILRKEDRQIMQKLSSDGNNNEDDEYYSRNHNDGEDDDDAYGVSSSSRHRGHHRSSQPTRPVNPQFIDRMSTTLDRVVHDVDRLKQVSHQRTTALGGIEERMQALKQELRQHGMDSVLFKGEIQRITTRGEEEERTVKRIEAEVENIKRSVKRNRYRIDRMVEMARRRAAIANGGGGGGDYGGARDEEE